MSHSAVVLVVIFQVVAFRRGTTSPFPVCVPAWPRCGCAVLFFGVLPATTQFQIVLSSFLISEAREEEERYKQHKESRKLGHVSYVGTAGNRDSLRNG